MPDINYLFALEDAPVRLRRLGPATVTAVCGEQVEVSTDGRIVLATLAVTGVYTPVAGDTVLVIEAEAAYVIGVLHATGPLTLRAPGDLTLSAPNGRIALHANEITGNASELRLAATVLSLTAERMAGRFATLRQVVTGAFDIDAGALAMRVKETFSLRGNRVRATAEEDVTLDGKHIHLG
jgi:hypothetical protein